MENGRKMEAAEKAAIILAKTEAIKQEDRLSGLNRPPAAVQEQAEDEFARGVIVNPE